MKNIPESTQKHIDDLVKTINKLNKERNKLALKNKELKEQLNIPDVMVSDLVKVENAYIEDANYVGSYDVTGRVEQLWITKEDFNKIKCISN
jgi:regulator of replication initiation timing